MGVSGNFEKKKQQLEEQCQSPKNCWEKNVKSVFKDLHFLLWQNLAAMSFIKPPFSHPLKYAKQMATTKGPVASEPAPHSPPK